MTEHIYPASSPAFSEQRRSLTPETEKAFQAFSQQVFADRALPSKIKQLIAVAVAHITQYPYCIRGHTRELDVVERIVDKHAGEIRTLRRLAI